MANLVQMRPKMMTESIDETPDNKEFDQAQLAPSEDRVKKADKAFARFQDLQIDPKALVGALQIITSCIVRRPKNNEFVRVFCDVDVEPFTGLVYEDKDEDAYYLVKPAALQFFYASPPTKMLVLTVNQNGSFFLWPVPTDDRNTWNDSARKAYQIAKTEWVKLVADRAAALYNTYVAEGELPPPRWPDKSYWELIDLAFPNSKVVDSAEHDVVHKIRTGQSRK
jgi:hypothetical protein